MRTSLQERLTFCILLGCTASPILAALAPGTNTSAPLSSVAGSRILTTLTVCLGSMSVALAIGIPAGITTLSNRKVSGWLLLPALSALTLPPVIHGAAWLTLITREAALNSVAYCCLIQGFALAPITALVFAAASSSLDPDLDRAIRLESKGFQRFKARLKHLYATPLIASAATVAVLAGTTIAVTDLLLVRTLAEETFTRFQVDGYATTAALVIPIAIIGAVLAWRYCPERTEPANRAEKLDPAPKKSIPWGALPLLAGTILPVVFLFKQGGGIAPTLSRMSEFKAEFALSFITSLAAALMGLAIAWTIAWCGLRASRTTRKAIAAWLAFMLLTPGCFVGMGLIRICSRPELFWLYDSPGILILAQTLRALPFQVIILVPFLLRMPTAWLEQTSVDGGLGRLAAFRLLARPMAPGILASGLVGFILSIQEIDATSLVAPPGTPPLPMRFFTMLHYGLYPDVASMGILMMLAVIIPALLIFACLWATRSTPKN